MTRGRIAILVLLLLAAAAAVAMRLSNGAGESSPPLQASRLAAPNQVAALGTLEPSSRVRTLNAPGMNAILAELRAEAGADVAAGDVVALTDEHDLRAAERDAAREQVAVARARLEQTRAGAKPDELAARDAAINAARETLAQSERDLARSEALARMESVAESVLERDRLAVESARAALAEGEAARAALAEVREVDVRLREAELAAAEAAVAVAERALERTRIEAPISGRVLQVHARAGERVGERGILEMGAVSPMHAVAEVYEADVPRVAPGQLATIRVKSTDLRLAGRVVAVEPLVGRKVALDNDPVSDTDARVVEVRIELDPEGSAQVAGLTNARVEVLIEVAP
ncbi:MAG: efflux RND transporter periplasmic adaptor subunit [Candidatus Sumerlaeia bacterium]|nr:efflux RND transporter periplasmic adaptor subunit [Candidatus Sumerlaeia bacterium]